MASLQGYEALMARFRALNGAGSTPLMKTLGMAVVAESKTLEAPHRKTGNLGRTVHVGAVGPRSVEIVASANYAAVFQFGSRPHDITPNARKALRWATGSGRRLSGSPRVGAAVQFATIVHHPGTRPYPFVIEGAQIAVRKTFGDEIVNAWNNAA